MSYEKTQIECTKCLTITDLNSKSHTEDNNLKIGFNGRNIYRSYMYFNIDDVSKNIVIDSVELEIYLNKINTSHSKIEFYIHALEDEFNTDTTFKNQPKYYKKQIKFNVNKNFQGSSHINITDMFYEWRSNHIKNNGIIIKSNEKRKALANVSSNLDCDYECIPKLTVYFSNINRDERIMDVVEKYWTLKFYKVAFSEPVNVERIINGTFFIDNMGSTEIKAAVEVSANLEHWVEDNELIVNANSSQVLIAKYYGKYYRVRFNCLGYASVKLRFICEVYK